MVTSIWAWSKLIHSGPGSCATKLHNWTETMSFSYPWHKPWMQMISFYLPTCFLFTNIVIIYFFGRGNVERDLNISIYLMHCLFIILILVEEHGAVWWWLCEAVRLHTARPWLPWGLYIRYVLNVLTQVTTRRADSIAPGIAIIYLTIGH